MNFIKSFSGGYCRVEETRKEIEQQIQVWPCAMQSQNFAYNPGCAAAPVASTQNTVFSTQQITSSSPFRENATDVDWDEFLFGSSRNTHDTPVLATTSEEPAAGKIRPPKKHFAHITFIPSAQGLRPVVSHKRKRTAFTTDQLTALEGVFQNKPYVTREERSVLVQTLGIGDQAIKVWFQNRRLKQKKELEEELETAGIYTKHNIFAHTESLLLLADKDGRVTLTQQSIDELIRAIDANLPQNLDLTELVGGKGNTVTEVEESTSSSDSIHEPISPPEVGASEMSSCAQEWWRLEGIDPKQSLQRLLDVHRLF